MTLDNISEKEILPKGPEDETIPTQVAKIDEHCKFLRDQLERLQNELEEYDCERMRLLNRAREVHVVEDTAYKIVEIPVYPKKHVDVGVLKKLCPEEHARISANIIGRLKSSFEDKLTKMTISISQADVKAVINNKALLAQIIPEPKEPCGYTTAIVKK